MAATVICADGTVASITPKDGKAFGAWEIASCLGVGRTQEERLADGFHLLWNADGYNLCLAYNATATNMLARCLSKYPLIYGAAIVVAEEELSYARQ